MGAFTVTENEAVVGLASRSACEQGSIVCAHSRPASGHPSQQPSVTVPRSPCHADDKACAP